jgi:hypothetical protein
MRSQYDFGSAVFAWYAHFHTCREQNQNSSVVHELLSKKTAKEQAKLDQYRSHGAAVQAQCVHMTKENCMAANNAPKACRKMHKR